MGCLDGLLLLLFELLYLGLDDALASRLWSEVLSLTLVLSSVGLTGQCVSDLIRYLVLLLDYLDIPLGLYDWIVLCRGGLILLICLADSQLLRWGHIFAILVVKKASWAIYQSLVSLLLPQRCEIEYLKCWYLWNLSNRRGSVVCFVLLRHDLYVIDDRGGLLIRLIDVSLLPSIGRVQILFHSSRIERDTVNFFYLHLWLFILIQLVFIFNFLKSPGRFLWWCLLPLDSLAQWLHLGCLNLISKRHSWLRLDTLELILN